MALAGYDHNETGDISTALPHEVVPGYGIVTCFQFPINPLLPLSLSIVIVYISLCTKFQISHHSFSEFTGAKLLSGQYLDMMYHL